VTDPDAADDRGEHEPEDDLEPDLDDAEPDDPELDDPVQRARWSAALARLSPPECPVTGPWSLSAVDALEARFAVPRPARKALRQLDRVGAVRLSPVAVGLDNDEVPWARVTAIRTAPAVDVLTLRAIEREADRLRSLLPPVPGRKWVVNRVVGLLTGTLEQYRADHADGPRIVVSISHKGRLARTRSLEPGAVSAMLLAGVPGANDCLLRMASDRGIRVTAT
jgi:hypothetical protein